MERLKTHVKLGLVVREEADGLRQYVHVSTGNYHSVTARLYEDLGIFSCDPALAAIVAMVFNELTGAIPLEDYGPLLVAPHNMRGRFTELIRREVDHQRAGRPSGIRVKLNQLQDPGIICELYEASRAGVPITLCVRGLCCLRAGVPGLSPTIRVFSIVGRFLEHSRIYRFENGGVRNITSVRRTGCAGTSTTAWKPWRRSPIRPFELNWDTFLMCTKAITHPLGTCNRMGTTCAGHRRPASRPAKRSSFSSNSPRRPSPRAAKKQGTIGITECPPQGGRMDSAALSDP